MQVGHKFFFAVVAFAFHCNIQNSNAIDDKSCKVQTLCYQRIETLKTKN